MTRSATTSHATTSQPQRHDACAVALCGLVVALATGCKQQLLCAALDSCGGAMPVGDWVLDPAHPSCSEDLYTPPPDPRLVVADLPPARTPPPEPALYDWCLLLVTAPGDDIFVKPPRFFYEGGPIGSATLHYDAAGNYGLSTTRTGTYSLDFPTVCMRAFGAVDKPGSNICQQLQAGLGGKAPVRVRNMTCQANPHDPAGCLCAYDLSEVQESAGLFIPRNDGTILHLPGRDFPENVTYCSGGDRLQLTGAGGQYLFDRLGLRTMDLVKTTAINCTDRLKGLGEDGVDCGPACPFFCSVINCNDMMMGRGEDGVDCGPNCPVVTCP